MRNKSNFVCECAKCRKQYWFKDSAIVKKELYGSIISIKACPYCKSTSYTALKDIGWLNKNKKG